MNALEPDSNLTNVLMEIDRLASAIVERGYDDIQEEWDDYALHLPTYEFRKLVTFELYDAYFPPRRHEFELQLLTKLVDAVASSDAAKFVGGAIATGIVGSAAYDVLKNGLAQVVKAFRKVKRTHDAVQEIAENVQRSTRTWKSTTMLIQIRYPSLWTSRPTRLNRL